MRVTVAAWLTAGVLAAAAVGLVEGGSRPAAAQTVDERKAEAERLLQLCREQLQAKEFEAALQSCQLSATTH